MAIKPLGPPVQKQPIAKTPTAAPVRQSQQYAATGYSQGSGFDSGWGQTIDAYTKQIRGKDPIDRQETKVGRAKMEALTDPARAAEMLKVGAKDPQSGALMSGPVN